MENKYPIGGYAPGNYHCKCGTCGNQFAGDKQAVQCEPCAVAGKEKFDELSLEHQQALIERNAAIANIMLTYRGSGEQIVANQEAGMPLEEAIFQAGYSSGYEKGYERGRIEAATGAVWVKASTVDVKTYETYYAKWVDANYTLRSTGSFGSDGTFFWDKPGYVPIGKEERGRLYLLDESAGGKVQQPPKG
jgi:hypothetical protein